MSDTKTSDLTTTTGATTDILYVVSGGNSRQLSVANFITGASIVTDTNTRTLTNKTLTAPIIATISNTGTLTLPTSTDTLVGKNTTDTLTNKTLTSPAINTPTITSAVFATNADLNGVELIIDADADSSLTADTDDRIDFKLGGSDRFRMSTSDLDLVTATANIQVAGADPKRGIYVPAAAMYGATTSGAAAGQYESTTNKVNVKVLDFDTSADEYACFNIPAPDYWDLSTITAQFHWTSAGGTPDQTVTWAIQALARSNDDALDTAYGTAITVADTLIATNDEHITASTSAITVGGTPAKGDMLYFRIYRDVSEDNVSDDARLLGVRIKFGISQYDDS